MMIEHFNLDLYVEISQYDNEQRYQILLGKKPRTDIDELDYERLLKLGHCHLIYCITWLRETSKAGSLQSYILYNLTTRDF
jgi:hypothetical protein